MKHVLALNSILLTIMFLKPWLAEFSSLQIVSEVERTQLTTTLPMSGKNPQLAGFLLTQNRGNHYLSKAQPPVSKITLFTFRR